MSQLPKAFIDKLENIIKDVPIDSELQKSIMLHTITHSSKITGPITLEDVERALTNYIEYVQPKVRFQEENKSVDEEKESDVEVVPDVAATSDKSGVSTGSESEEENESEIENIPANTEELNEDIQKALKELNKHKSYLLNQKAALEIVKDYPWIQNTLLQFIEEAGQETEALDTVEMFEQHMFKYSLLHTATHMFLTRNLSGLNVKEWLKCAEKELEGKENDKVGQLEVLYRMVSFALTRGMCELFQRGWFSDYKLRTLLDRLAEKAADHGKKDVQQFMETKKKSLESICADTASLGSLKCSAYFKLAVFIMSEIAQLQDMMMFLKESNAEKLPVVPINAEELVRNLESLEQAYNKKIDPRSRFVRAAATWGKRALFLSVLAALALSKESRDTSIRSYSGLPGIQPPLSGLSALRQPFSAFRQENPYMQATRNFYQPSWCAVHNCTSEEWDQARQIAADRGVPKNPTTEIDSEIWADVNLIVGSRIGRQRLDAQEVEQARALLNSMAAKAAAAQAQAQAKAVADAKADAKAEDAEKNAQNLVNRDPRLMAAEADAQAQAKAVADAQAENAQILVNRDPRLLRKQMQMEQKARYEADKL